MESKEKKERKKTLKKSLDQGTTIIEIHYGVIKRKNGGVNLRFNL